MIYFLSRTPSAHPLNKPCFSLLRNTKTSTMKSSPPSLSFPTQSAMQFAWIVRKEVKSTARVSNFKIQFLRIRSTSTISSEAATHHLANRWTSEKARISSRMSTLRRSSRRQSRLMTLTPTTMSSIRLFPTTFTLYWHLATKMKLCKSQSTNLSRRQFRMIRSHSIPRRK